MMRHDAGQPIPACDITATVLHFLPTDCPIATIEDLDIRRFQQCFQDKSVLLALAPIQGKFNPNSSGSYLY